MSGDERTTDRTATGAVEAEAERSAAKAAHDGESCDECGQPYDYVWWCFDPSLWEAVTGHAKPPGDNAAGLLCIPCFDRLAKDRACWLEWAPLNLRHLEHHPKCQSLAQPARNPKSGTHG